MARNSSPNLAAVVVAFLGEQLRLIDLIQQVTSGVAAAPAKPAGDDASPRPLSTTAVGAVLTRELLRGGEALLQAGLLPARGLAAMLGEPQPTAGTSLTNQAVSSHGPLVLLASQGLPATKTFLIENLYDHKVSVVLAISGLRAMSDGKVQSKKLTLSPRRLAMEPGERRAITIGAQLDYSMIDPGEYQASVRVVGLNVPPILVHLKVTAES